MMLPAASRTRNHDRGTATDWAAPSLGVRKGSLTEQGHTPNRGIERMFVEADPERKTPSQRRNDAAAVGNERGSRLYASGLAVHADS